MKNLFSYVVATLFAFTLFDFNQARAGDVKIITVEFQFKDDHYCKYISPKIVLKNIPPATIFLRVAMTDLSNGNDHGGATIPYSGNNIILENALNDYPGGTYKGPCPPTAHSYEITVKALARDRGTVLAVGSSVREFN
jgi:hypothetical protein